MNERQSDQPTGAQPGEPNQYRQSTAGGGQRGNIWGQSSEQSAHQSPGSGGIESGQQAPTRGQGTSVHQGAAGGDLQGQLFPTRTYLGEDVRVRTIETLNRVLADTTVLHTHAKFAHWNVKGLEFVGLHELFDEIAETFEAHTDLVGERITALGGQAMGTAGMAVSNCSLPAMPTDAVTGAEYVEILADRLAVHDANLYQAIQTAQQYGDDDTADLLNEVSREVSQHLWFLEAHLQTQPVGASGAAGSVTQQAGASQRSQGRETSGASARQPGSAQGSTTTTSPESETGQSPGGGTSGPAQSGGSTHQQG